ncbi:MAG: hypothetical protein GF355_09705 [Candidatus Eisenbacteria bacterium]|nr:hypothetical protein [Candidatus Eisenbacteria bacterium]
MNSPQNAQEPREIVAGRLVADAAEILARDMDEVFLDYLGSDIDPRDPHQRAAETANRIVVLCRKVFDEVRRYERYAWLCRQIEQEEEEENRTL